MAYQFDCKTAGATGCNWKARANSEEELVNKVAEHAQKKHKVGTISDTIVDYVRSAIRQS
jgi:predicted small metal-binding protein